MNNFLKKVIEFFKKFLSNDDSISSKRVITFLSFLLLTVGFMANLFFDFTIEAFIYESILWIVLFGIGAVASERFTKYGNKMTGEKTNEDENLEG